MSEEDNESPVKQRKAEVVRMIMKVGVEITAELLFVLALEERVAGLS